MADRLRILQRVCFGVGAALIAFWAVAQVHREIGLRNDLQAFEEARQAMTEARLARAADGAAGSSIPVAELPAVVPSVPAESEAGGASVTAADDEVPTLPVATGLDPESDTGDSLPPPPMPESLEYDYSLWSPKRVEDYEASLEIDTSSPQALLRIPTLDLQVPVLEGIDELTLNRGVGRIPGTARLGGLGNIGIAGHRDGFFRVLKDISVGDEIEVLTWRERFRYTVTEIDIVDKHDVHVLTASDDSMVTLVTCYPFYFVGHAPRRYIVKASLAGAEII